MRFLTVTEFKKLNPSMGKNKIYEAVKSGELPSIKIGSKYYIPEDAMEQLLQEQKEESKE